VLLLDEPYTGLDRRSALMLDAVLEEAGASSRTVLLTTHNLERGLSMCRRVALLTNGKIVHEMNEQNWDLDRFQEVYEQRVSSEESTAETPLPAGGQR
jgi:ABC-type multidrug transport system ATPase subunit